MGSTLKRNPDKIHPNSLRVKQIFTFDDFPGNSEGKESVCNVRDARFIPGSGRFPAEGNGNPLQYSCLENSMDRGA